VILEAAAGVAEEQQAEVAASSRACPSWWRKNGALAFGEIVEPALTQPPQLQDNRRVFRRSEALWFEPLS
jgi:hypothetical protein